MPGRRPQIASLLVYRPGDLEHGAPEHAAVVTGIYPGNSRVDLWVLFRNGNPSSRMDVGEISLLKRTGWRWPTPERKAA